MSNQQKIGFIGGGHMASAILQGLVEVYQPQQIYVADHHKVNRDKFSSELNINTAANFSDFIDQVEVIVLAIKPQDFPQLLPKLHSSLTKNQLIISIASGVTVKAIHQGLAQASNPIIRAMPNIPATIRLGATALYADPTVTTEHKSIAETIFNACGITTWVEKEQLISAVVAVSGSSPAYFFYMLEVMINAGVSLGLSQENSARLAKQTMLGSASLCLKSDLSVTALKKSVMSPQGTTEQAIFSLENSGFEAMMQQAMKAAADRDQELSQEISAKLK